MRFSSFFPLSYRVGKFLYFHKFWFISNSSRINVFRSMHSISMQDYEKRPVINRYGAIEITRVKVASG